jgi:hypothetical protein
MSTDVQRPVPSRIATQFVDENGVPKISSSIPLALLGLGLFVGVPMAALLLFRMLRMAATGEASEGGETWELPGDYRRMLWVTGALRTLAFAWMCLAAYNFFSRRSAAPWILIVMYGGLIGLNMLEGMWEASFADGDPTYASDAIRAAVVPSIWSAIWSVYLWRSQTVKRVFVYPLADEPTSEHGDASGESPTSASGHAM